MAVLAGCASVGEGPSASSVTAPSAFVYAPPVESRATLATLLPNEDPAFQSLLTAVETQAPDLQVALARVDAARAALRAAGAARAPNIGVEGNASYARSSENAVTNLPPGFTIACTLCDQYLAGGGIPSGLRDEVERALNRLEEAADRRFGDATR
ncbi:MAG: TolC family protein, partial [Chloroflexota bacterium]